MSFSEVSARMREHRERQEQAAAPKAVDFAESYRLRARVVGVLLRDAREHARRTQAECAALLHVDIALIAAWEYGDDTPSLPQLELLANYLDVPVSHFWGTATLQSAQAEQAQARHEYLVLRDRIIGVMLRQAREAANMTIDMLAERCGLTVEQVEQYELGEVSIPMHILTVAANGVNKNVSYFLESGSAIGEWLAMREMWQQFAELPQELKRFVSNPRHSGFIEIARMFSQMPTDQLRKIGEAFLDITM
jgi:transcriptional regulator with XRE-family HTH domain